MADITLSSAVRRNLLSLQNTAMMMGKTQQRLATGKKVNSALDNPTNFFTAASLSSRSKDLGRLLDNVGNAIQTLEAADNGIKGITRLVESAQSTARQALQSPEAIITPASSVGSTIAVAGVNGSATAPAGITGSFIFATTTNVNASIEITTDGKSLTQIANEISALPDITATVAQDASTGTFRIEIVVANTETFSVKNGVGTAASQLGIYKPTASVTAQNGIYIDMNVPGNPNTNIASLADATIAIFDIEIDGTITTINLTGEESISEIATLINNVAGVKATVEPDGPAGSFRLKIVADDGVDALKITDTTGTSAATLGINGDSDVLKSIAPSAARQSFEKEFNDLLKQIDQLSKDAGFNGNNLLNLADLKVIFNENGTSALTIIGADVTTLGMNLHPAAFDAFQSNSSIEGTLNAVEAALTTLRSQASSFGSNLSVVQTRQDFTRQMISTLETGAANLTLADINEEGANMLALQTRQQLSITALSMASQADQSVLNLF